MKHKIVFLLWLMILAVLWIAGNLDAALLILAATIICTGFLILQAALQAGRMNLHSHVQTVDAGKKKAYTLSVQTDCHGFLPVLLEITLEIENKLTGDIRREKITRMVSKEYPSFTADFEERYSGKVKIRSLHIKAADVLGLVGFKVKGKIKGSCLLIPDAVATEMGNSLPYYYDMNSDRFSETRSGDDLSEVFDVREYQEGDRIHAVHWKLSAKSDELIMKEGSYPINNRVLLLLENGYSLDKAEEEKEQLELACGTLISLSENLSDKGIPHHIGWWNEAELGVQIQYIDSPEKLAEALSGLLSSTLSKRTKSILEKYYEEKNNEDFSFIMVIDDEFREKQLLQN